jgi:hypothetical protein
MPTEEQIKQLAYTLWEQEGRPEGRDVHYYLTAKEILEERGAAQRPASARRPAAPKSPRPRTRTSRAKKR